MPNRDLLDQLWEMDKEKSFARLTISPIKEGDKSYYLFEQELWIKPYPNPFSYGGFWGQGTAKTTEELNRIVSYFKEEVAEWQGRGLTKIEIIHHPEMTRVAHRNQKRAEQSQKDIEAGEKPASQTTQLALM